ncbi:hypothetical protein [Terrisporobacter hibernicus]|uniref:Uncharacterized protein n=1 Tax=Terrisporobacter hibernicus TaxID=2813371 RepID=A0AAX2ZG48_9FIRM|nr:hypothetical protein [Terrisporobacter hibernicus]UEL47337.1 hypothetical protein JW646_17155 [Terrisporobacter hibernicus]
MHDREKLENLNKMLTTLISTCESEILITTRMLIDARSNNQINRLVLEKAFWEGKLEVAKYAKLFSE